jgi:hypothetical protein
VVCCTEKQLGPHTTASMGLNDTWRTFRRYQSKHMFCNPESNPRVVAAESWSAGLGRDWRRGGTNGTCYHVTRFSCLKYKVASSVCFLNYLSSKEPTERLELEVCLQ